MKAGPLGERIAEKELRRQGITLLERNLRSAGGEIDLVGFERGVVVFVEVKSRTSDAFGTAEEAVDLAKRRTLVRAARAFLARKGIPDHARRYDVAAVELSRSGEPKMVRWIRNAFDEEESR